MTALFITLFLPFLGSLVLLFMDKGKPRIIKTTALGISIVTFIASLFIYAGFRQGDTGNIHTFQFVYEALWVGSLDAGFRIGIDGLSLLMVLLTTFITPIAIFSSFEAIKKREKEYYIMMLLLQFAMTGVFVALDTFLFYIFWEIILIPMYFLIGIWGGKDRIYATVKFFIFTVVGSLFMLIAIVWLGYYVGNNLIASDTFKAVTLMPSIYTGEEAYKIIEIIKNAKFTTNLIIIRELAPMIPTSLQLWMFLAFALSFCIKVPLFPLHTWLPDAHTEAPTAGSVILAGVLLKMGTYGLVRFNLDLFPQASFHYAPYIAWLAVIGIVYGALVSMVQTDVKRLVAYSSVSHLGFVVLGIFSMTEEGLQGAIIQMVNHGLSTGMLFLCVGIIYERRHTREISEFGGIARVMPAYTVFFAIAMLASAGLPGLNGFVGEYLTLLGAFRSPFLHSYSYSIIAASGVIFAAVYLLWMFQRVMYGTNDNPHNHNLKDLTKAEWVMLVPIVIFIVWIGVYPKTFLNVSKVTSKNLIQKVEAVKKAGSNYRQLLIEPAGLSKNSK